MVGVFRRPSAVSILCESENTGNWLLGYRLFDLVIGVRFAVRTDAFLYCTALYLILVAHLLRYSWGSGASLRRAEHTPHPPTPTGRRGYEIYGVCAVLSRAQE